MIDQRQDDVEAAIAWRTHAATRMAAKRTRSSTI